MRNVISFLKKCTHIGHGNRNGVCNIGDIILGRTIKVKHLGVKHFGVTFRAEMIISEKFRLLPLKVTKLYG